MKNTINKTFVTLILTAAFAAATFAQNSKDFLITENSVGKVKLGMTIGEAKKIWKDYQFEMNYDHENETYNIAVKSGSEILMLIESHEDFKKDENPAVIDSAEIIRIEILSRKFHTAEGVTAQMPLTTAELFYGKVDCVYESEAEESISFQKPPTGINFYSKKYYQTSNASDKEIKQSTYISKIIIRKEIYACPY